MTDKKNKNNRMNYKVIGELTYLPIYMLEHKSFL